MELSQIEKAVELYKDLKGLQHWHQVICAGELKITVTVSMEPQLPFAFLRDEPHEIDAAIDLDTITSTAKYKILEAIEHKIQQIQEKLKAI